MQEYREYGKKLITNDMDKAMDGLLNDIHVDSKFYNEILLHKAALIVHRVNFRKGTLEYDKLSREEQRIRNALLEVLDELTNVDLIAPSFSLLQKIFLEVDPRIAAIIVSNKYPLDWSQRLLYIGDIGSKQWNKMSENPRNINSDNNSLVSNCLIGFLSNLNIDSFISFGPGNGIKDKNLLDNMNTNRLKYYPIDISFDLLIKTWLTMHEAVNIPFGILSCFESRFCTFIKNKLINEAKGVKLISLLGNTFGNLDRREYKLMDNVKDFLKVGDYVLLEVSSKKIDYAIEKDEGAIIGSHSEEMKIFLANGMSKRLGIPTKKILKLYTEFLSIDVKVEDKKSNSNINNTVEIKHMDKKKHNKILSIRRYDHKSLEKWLETFSFIIEKEEFIPFDDKVIGVSCFLLKKY